MSKRQELNKLKPTCAVFVCCAIQFDHVCIQKPRERYNTVKQWCYGKWRSVLNNLRKSRMPHYVDEHWNIIKWKTNGEARTKDCVQCTSPKSRSVAHFLDFFLVLFIMCTHIFSLILHFVFLSSFMRPWILSRSFTFSCLYSFLFDHIILIYTIHMHQRISIQSRKPSHIYSKQ